MMKYICEVSPGTKFGRLTFIELAHRSDKSRQWNWKCMCDCGKEVISMGGNIRSGRTISCGCYQKIRASQTHKRHGLTGTRIHRIWKNMKQRCFNEKNPRFMDYGGRGIGMHSDWKDNFESFLNYVGQPEPHQSLERINNNLGYEPGNVRWATNTEQVRNRRVSVKVDFNGSKHIKELCEEIGSDYYRTYDLIVRRKMKVSDAVALLAGSKKPTC